MCMWGEDCKKENKNTHTTADSPRQAVAESRLRAAQVLSSLNDKDKNQSKLLQCKVHGYIAMCTLYINARSIINKCDDVLPREV